MEDVDVLFSNWVILRFEMLIFRDVMDQLLLPSGVSGRTILFEVVLLCTFSRLIKLW